MKIPGHGDSRRDTVIHARTWQFTMSGYVHSQNCTYSHILSDMDIHTFPLLNIYDFNTVPVIATGSEIKRIEEEAEAAVETSEVSKQTGLHN
jgi:hypothetical protein